MSDTFTIRRVFPGEPLWQEACTFIEDVAHAAEGADPPPPPQTLFVIIEDGALIGTVGVDFTDADGRLPMESVWDFSDASMPMPFVRAHIAQIGRWMAKRPYISAAALYTAAEFSLAQGKHTGLFEAKARIAEHLAGMDFVFFPIQGGRLRLNEIPERQRAYYARDEGPKQFLFRLEQLRWAMARHMPPVLAAVRDPERFSITFALQAHTE